jgi:hypothetical protein
MVKIDFEGKCGELGKNHYANKFGNKTMSKMRI